MENKEKREDLVVFKGPVFFSGKCSEEVQEVIDCLKEFIEKLDKVADRDIYRYCRYSSDPNHKTWNIVRNKSEKYDSFGLFNDGQHCFEYVCYLLYFKNKDALRIFDIAVDLENRITYGDLSDKEFNARRRGCAIRIMKSIIDEIDFSKVDEIRNEINEQNDEDC